MGDVGRVRFSCYKQQSLRCSFCLVTDWLEILTVPYLLPAGFPLIFSLSGALSGITQMSPRRPSSSGSRQVGPSCSGEQLAAFCHFYCSNATEGDTASFSLGTGSRRLFGAILESKVCILLDTSGSTGPYLQGVKSEMVLLIWEQLRKHCDR